MSEAGFKGFPARTEVTPLPNIFFTEVLPHIENLAEVKVVMQVFFLLSRRKGYPRFVSFKELDSDPVLVKELRHLAPATGDLLKQTLELAVQGGILLHVPVDMNGRSDDLYFINNQAEKDTIDKIVQGTLKIPDVAVRKEEEPKVAQPSDIYNLYEQNIGMLTPIMAEELQEAEHRYPAEWIQEAFREALMANVRNWKYIHSILKRWREKVRKMENLSEILGKKETLINISGENTGTWSGDNAAKPGDSGDRPECPVCLGTRFIHPLLPSGEPDYSRLISCSCARNEIDGKRMQRLQAISNLGNVSKLTFESLIPTGRSNDPVSQKLFQLALDEALKFAEMPRGWLVIAGPVGSGKTHLACAVANYRISNGHSAFYITADELLDHLRAAFSPGSEIEYDELFEQIKDSPLLVLDNLNYSATTAWSKGKLDQLLEHRFNSKLPTLVTTSTPVEEFENDYAGHINDPEFSKVLILKKQSSSLQSLDSLDLPLLKKMRFETFELNLSLQVNERQSLEGAFNFSRNFAAEPQGWLILQGYNGCGKTHLAAAIANQLRESGKEVLFIVVPDLLDHLRSSFGPDSRVSYDALFEKIKKVPVLVLDDFGEHSATPWAQEKLYQLINYRYNAQLATVITTVLSLDDMDGSVSSRLADLKIGTALRIQAPDYRALKTTRAPRARPKPRA